MFQHLRPAIVLIVLFTILTGVIYPFAITGIAAVVVPGRAGGSMITPKDVVIGSSLIGQNFTSDKYFHGRPSATNTPDPKDPTKNIDAPYNAANSGASNYGATSQALFDRVKGDVEAMRKDGAEGPLPADALTTSASGLDPDISPAFAQLQVARVAKARNLPEDRVRALVLAQTDGRFLGFIGEPRVNVLLLNLALDGLPTG
ncbi:K+-transporting ATPase ATPase C chain [Rhizobiales bacterium GAS191]|nr:K+-transporting ATPase ATPase C chain [Rhizobiales bacterium GAS188]SEE52669.1 K+-transporting ATPase ATPase C chain [Rhizobiales bacterium GAS191]